MSDGPDNAAFRQALALADLRERLNGETAMRLYYQYLAASGGAFVPWNNLNGLAQEFWHKIARDYVALTL